jgi:hypothetical protein
MQIWHRANLSPEVEPWLQDHKVRYEYVYSSIDPSRVTNLLATVSESNSGWPHIAQLVTSSAVTVWTEFTRDEILEADWLIARPEYAIGYPRPEETIWSSLYTENRCAKCGVGWRQIAPFQIQKEPGMRRYSFASFWGGFELFCSPEVVATFESEHIEGYTIWPILLHKTGEPSRQLQQVIVPQTAEEALVEEVASSEHFAEHLCPNCNQTWYDHHLRGMLPLKRAALLPDVDFQRTIEWFGNGRTARREILVSRRIARLVIRNNWKGIGLSPVKLV